VPLALLYSRWIWEVLNGREHFTFRRSLLLPFGVFAFFCVFSITRAVEPTFTLYELLSLAYCFLIYFYLVGNIRSRRMMRLIVLALVFSVALQSVVTTAQVITGSSLGMEYLGGADVLMVHSWSGAGQATRASGTLGHPNSLAIYIELLLPLVLGVALLAETKLRRLLLAGTFFLGAFALVQTLSRGGMMAGGASLLIFLFLWGMRARRLKLVGGIIIAGVATVALLMVTVNNPIKQRFVEDRYETALVRVPLMQVATRMLGRNFWFGVGLNNYTYAAEQYDNTLERITIEFPAPVHNLYLLALVEIGVFGFLAVIIFLIGLVAKGIKLARAPDLEMATYGLALTMGVVSLLMHGMVDYVYLTKLFPFWFVAGAIVGLWHLNSSNPIGDRTAVSS